MPNLTLTGKSGKVRICPDPLSGYLHPGQVVEVEELTVDMMLAVESGLVAITTLPPNRPLIYGQAEDRDADDPRMARWARGAPVNLTAEERLSQLRAKHEAEHQRQTDAMVAGRRQNLTATAQKARGRGAKGGAK